MKLGFILERTKNNSNYRVTTPMRALEQRGHTVVRATNIAEDVSMRALMQCDLVHCFRREDRIADLRALSARGVAITFDNDDDVASSDHSLDGKKAQRLVANRKVFARYLKAAQIADLVTTPSHTLAEKYRAAGIENVAVIENYLDRDTPGFGSRSSHDGIVVGWVAAREHADDLAHFDFTGVLTQLLDTYPDVRIVTVGVPFKLRSERYEHIRDVPYTELLQTTSKFDIGIAPLVDSAFNRARSSVKLKEYAAGGAAWMASPVGPYRGLGEKQGGMLVDDDGWLAALDRIIASRRTRARLARRALRWAKTQTIDRHVNVWEAAFEAAIERAGERTAHSAGALATHRS